ncbi:MAG: phosphoesterase, partial [Alphaproteobacteria bacterium]|nr:phosphoesterase [Alphaproteobacteria bacterium]
MSADLSLNGATLALDASGAVFWPAGRLLAVADLHLEKGSAFARTGQLLPPYDSLRTLAALEDAITRFQPESVICLGDSFHDPRAAERMDASALCALTDL